MSVKPYKPIKSSKQQGLSPRDNLRKARAQKRPNYTLDLMATKTHKRCSLPLLNLAAIHYKPVENQIQSKRLTLY